MSAAFPTLSWPQTGFFEPDEVAMSNAAGDEETRQHDGDGGRDDQLDVGGTGTRGGH